MFVDDSDPHIIGIIEPCANSDVRDAEMALECCVMVRKYMMGRK